MSIGGECTTFIEANGPCANPKQAAKFRLGKGHALTGGPNLMRARVPMLPSIFVVHTRKWIDKMKHVEFPGAIAAANELLLALVSLPTKFDGHRTAIDHAL